MASEEPLVPGPATVDRVLRYARSGEPYLHRTHVGHLAEIIKRREAMIAEGFHIMETEHAS